LNKVGKSSAGAVLTAASPPARLGLVPKSLDLRGLGTRSLFADLPREFLPQSVVCLRSGIKANSSVRKFPEKNREISGFQVLLRWSRVSMEAGCMLMLGGGVFGRGPLGQGATSACRGWWCCLRKAEWVLKNPRKVLRVGFSGRLARVRAGVYRTLSGCPGRLGPEGRGSRDLFSAQLPVLRFIIAAFSVHLMRNNNNDLNSNKRFNNFTNRLT